MRLVLLLSLAAPVQAGVVAPVGSAEAGVAPVAPVYAPVGGGFSQGLPAASGLGALLPSLPLPAPGLVNFAPPSAPASAEASASAPAPASAESGFVPSSKGRARPVVPGEGSAAASPAGVFVPRRRDVRASAASEAAASGAIPGAAGSVAAEIEKAAAFRAGAPESGVGAGRRFWDQAGLSGELGSPVFSAASEDGPADETAAFSGGHAGGAFRRAGTPSASDASAFGEEGLLRDAVGSPFASRSAAPAGAGAWRVAPSAAGESAFGPGALRPGGASGSSALPVAAAVPSPLLAPPSRPERLAMFVFGPRLSVTLGLVSAPNGEAPAALSGAAGSARPIGTTEWLERAALLEAVSASQSFAAPAAHTASELLAASSRGVAPFSPAPVENRRSVPLWTGWLLLLPLAALLRRLS